MVQNYQQGFLSTQREQIWILILIRIFVVREYFEHCATKNLRGLDQLIVNVEKITMNNA